MVHSTELAEVGIEIARLRIGMRDPVANSLILVSRSFANPAPLSPPGAFLLSPNYPIYKRHKKPIKTMKKGMRDWLTALLALKNQSTSLKSFVTELCICFKGGASYHILKKHYRLGMWINK